MAAANPERSPTIPPPNPTRIHSRLNPFSSKRLWMLFTVSKDLFSSLASIPIAVNSLDKVFKEACMSSRAEMLIFLS